jgi:hypothetical protein
LKPAFIDDNRAAPRAAPRRAAEKTAADLVRFGAHRARTNALASRVGPARSRVVALGSSR